MIPGVFLGVGVALALSLACTDPSKPDAVTGDGDGDGDGNDGDGDGGDGDGDGGDGDGGGAPGGGAPGDGDGDDPATGGAVGSGGMGGASTGGMGTGGDTPVDDRPTLYPKSVHSPVTPLVALRIMNDLQSEPARRVFLKAGNQLSASSSYLGCFDGAPNFAATGLEDTASYFLAGDAGGSNPFARVSLAAEAGRDLNWLVTGGAPPWDQEIAAIAPAWALVYFGTNEIAPLGLGADAEAFARDLDFVAEDARAQGIIPLFIGPPLRTDTTEAAQLAPFFNDIVRGIAQAHQVPYLDLQAALENVTSFGLAADGVSLRLSTQGACDLSNTELDFGQNMTNKSVLEMLDRVLEAIEPGRPVDDPIVLEGAGTSASPFVIAELPFADFRTTADSNQSEFDVYSGCSAAQDESGPEYVYELVLEQETALRIFVASHSGEVAPYSDIDIHVLSSGGQPSDCIARNNRLIEGTFAAGTYTIVADTYVSASTPQLGAYSLIVSECVAGDASCAP